MNFFSENLRVFKRVFLPLYALVVLSGSADQYLNVQLENALQSPDGASQGLYLFGFFSVLSGILFPVLLMTLCLQGLNSLQFETEDLAFFIRKNLNQIFIETLRSWGKTLLWSLFLILPGVWKYIEYLLVPIVVTSSSRYSDGLEDALDASRRIVRRHWLKITSIFVFFHLFTPLLLSVFFDSFRLVWKTPLASLCLSLLDTYLLLLTTHLLFKIFKSEEKKHVPTHV